MRCIGSQLRPARPAERCQWPAEDGELADAATRLARSLKRHLRLASFPTVLGADDGRAAFSIRRQQTPEAVLKDHQQKEQVPGNQARPEGPKKRDSHLLRSRRA
jgi:hypothetical protein